MACKRLPAERRPTHTEEMWAEEICPCAQIYVCIRIDTRSSQCGVIT